jgi:hypothetical protein
MTKVFRMVTLAVALVLAKACAAPSKAPAPGPAPAGAPAEDAVQTITRLEHEWVQAIAARDPAAIERLLADDFTGATDETTYGKGDASEDARVGGQRIEVTDVAVRVYGDSAVVTLDQVENGEERYRFTNVWARQDGRWRAVASHGLRLR